MKCFIKRFSVVIPCLLISIVMLMTTSVSAQFSRKEIKRNNQRMYTYRGARKVKFGLDKKYSAFEITVNAFNYYGDLSPSPKQFSTDISLTKPGIGVGYLYRLGSQYSLQANFVYGTISGSDNSSANKNDL